MADYYTDTSIRLYGAGNVKPKIGPIGLCLMPTGISYFDKDGFGHMSTYDNCFYDGILAAKLKEHIFGNCEVTVTVTPPNEEAREAKCFYDVMQAAYQHSPELIGEEMLLAASEEFGFREDTDNWDVSYENVIAVIRCEPGADIAGYTTLSANTCSKHRYGEFFGGMEFSSDLYTRYTNSVNDLTVSENIYERLFKEDYAAVGTIFYNEFLELIKGVNGWPSTTEKIIDAFLLKFEKK